MPKIDKDLAEKKLMEIQSQEREEDITKCFSLHDIALWTTSLSRGVEYDSAIHKGMSAVQTFRSVEPQMFNIELEGDDEQHLMLRALVTLGIRSVYKADERADEEILYTLEATFGVEYLIIKLPSSDQFAEFLDFNCVHNAWSFWRQHVFDTFKRASLPVPAVPFFPGRRPDRAKSSNQGEDSGAELELKSS
ncbi:hypothetical protein [Xanthomonas arboricola]|uniref:hypothetical protein n=1 Tax=Xanthomonas arboricola TaxID=56448 RepID=UPI00118B7370|nr:hypothetical protein [Xanthomonas arboricola]QDS15804.1 hypothetical protein FPL04_09200 [Xanthomonas arboricola]